MDISNLIKFAQTGEWQEFCHQWELENQEKNTLAKLEELEKFLAKTKNKISTQIQSYLKKWVIWNLSTSWQIESGQEQTLKTLNEKYISDLHANQLIILLEISWQNGEIRRSHNLLEKILGLEQINQSCINNATVLQAAKFFSEPKLTLLHLFHCINHGNQELALRVYKIFYHQYFANFAIDDQESKLWEDLWNKVNEIKENWYNWELLKIDIGLITDIIIKNKTGLKIPYFRKKRELAQAIVVRKELPTLYSTLLKYLSNTEHEVLFEMWLELWIAEKKIHNANHWDRTINQIILLREINKPRNIPLELTLSEDEDSTQALTALDIGIDQIEYQGNVLTDEKSSSRFKLHIPNLTMQASWKEQLNIYMLHGQYKNALELISTNEKQLSQDEKSDYELLTLELMLKLKQFQEILSRLDAVWKNVQELETFKGFKYIEAEALWGLNRKREAADCFRKVVDIDPNYKLARWRLVEYSL